MADRRAGRGRARDEGPEGWSFRGSAHYQFHLVRSSVARQFVPPDLPLVELAGYTLGGFYYANYADSPAGRMDELVVLSGLVWNAPTSCAWASHVFVDRRSAVSHGRRVFGLPSRLRCVDSQSTQLCFKVTNPVPKLLLAVAARLDPSQLIIQRELQLLSRA